MGFVFPKTRNQTPQNRIEQSDMANFRNFVKNVPIFYLKKRKQRFFFKKHRIFLILRGLYGFECLCTFVIYYHMLKFHTLVPKISLITIHFLKERLSPTHSLLMDTVFWVQWVPLGSDPKSDLTVATTYIRGNVCPNFVLLALLVPEIMRLKGIMTS